MNKEVILGFSKEEKEILSNIQKKPGIGKEELLNATGYKSTTTNRILDKLKKLDLIVISGEGDSTGGRRPLLYSVNPGIPIYGIGVNLALNHADVSLVHFDGRVISSREVAFDRATEPAAVLKIIATLYREQLDEQGIPACEICAVGAAVVVKMDEQRRNIVASASLNLLNPTWIGYPLRAELEAIFGMHVEIENATTTGCIGEYLFGIGENYEKISFFTCRNTIRVSCIHKGHIIRMPDNVDDAFGHLVVRIGGKPCVCGNYGCLNTYASLSSIVEDFTYGIRHGRVSSLQDKSVEQITGQEILAAGEENDQLAVEVITKAATTLGIGIANYIKLVNPDLIILGGELFRRSALYFKTVEHTVQRQLYFTQSEKKVVFKMRSEMGKAANGAAVMALEVLLDHWY